jgi:hypothetical protein
MVNLEKLVGRIGPNINAPGANDSEEKCGVQVLLKGQPDVKFGQIEGQRFDSGVLLARVSRASYVVEQVDDNSITSSETGIPKPCDELSNKRSGLRGIETA